MDAECGAVSLSANHVQSGKVNRQHRIKAKNIILWHLCCRALSRRTPKEKPPANGAGVGFVGFT
jgi:hypothetical protein